VGGGRGAPPPRAGRGAGRGGGGAGRRGRGAAAAAPEAAVLIASDQPRLLEGVLERYREIERRGGWTKVPTDLVMGPGYSYDCERIGILERRLVAEGYLERVRRPLPPPVLTPEQAKAKAKADAKAKAQAKLQPVSTRKTLGTWGECDYGSELTAAVKAFQADRKVLGYGQVGKLTFTELNRPVGEIVDILEQDLARWRNRGLEPSGSYLLVNIPFFELVAFEDDEEVMRMPVVVGQKSWQTPQFSDALEYVIVNPDWGIPEKIAKQEYWPSAKRNPKWLAAQGIVNDGGALRQKPGPQNPLGRIKFVMPNENDVYLHDTPAKRAFDAAVRALSHGCVRLSRPMDLANYLLRDEPEWDSRRLQSAVASGQTKRINLRRNMPVHIVYSTSRVNVDGRLELRPDVYGKNRSRGREEDAWPPGDARARARPGYG
jgi:murein L,D-transpeptidase YcbB/YkuD